jgi:putative glycosyltransferase (TIGR04348 family)
VVRKLGHQVEIAAAWRGEDCDLLIALHARRSQQSVENFRRSHPVRPVIVGLTGTDLYGDLPASGAGRRSLALATSIVALQEAARDALDEAWRAKTTVIYQSSAAPLARRPPDPDHFDVCVLSHLRTVKDPLQAAYAARLLPPESRVRVIHAGRALEPEWESKARAEELFNPRYLWIGEQPHESGLELLASSRLLVLSSTMEGGSNAISEAVMCGVPVLCSFVPGNIGMLGPDYPGYFRVGGTAELAGLLLCAELDSAFLNQLRAFINTLEHRFAPEQEQAAWARLLSQL